VIAATVLSIGCLWAGYAIGYHHGVRDERQEWWSSGQQDSKGRLVFTWPHNKYRFDTPYVARNPIPEKLTK